MPSGDASRQLDLAGAVHDAGNALQVVSATLRLIERRMETGQAAAVAALLAVAQDQVVRAGVLLRHTLDAGTPAPPGPRLVELQGMVHGIQPQMAALAGDGIRLELKPDSGGGLVRCDPARLESAITNLVLNACRAMGGRGVLTVGVRQVLAGQHGVRAPGPVTAYAAVTVADTGPGMDGDTLARVFAPYVTTKAPGPGTGLGLFQVRTFAEAAGGFIRLESQVGSGTSALLCLPLASIDDC